ncbi:hypothetical protein [Desulfoferrobacter suflitae]|uniref:hypothetical protein n=1 Tax=Desulfoferrobacter suflitae TaxID=2865782 RepID=UPI002164A674|nr:hypothetical protein [Desulfoferrobacter suflitae]MCK8604415.1 hypothetical protein [Desulfoferrobacter suflitae]
MTESESLMIEGLPKPPPVAGVKTTNIWLIEWLSPAERRTGRELHEWMETKRSGWSIYNSCDSKAEVLEYINRAAAIAERGLFVPLLHIEAHGGGAGIAPSASRDAEFLSWEELTDPLQQLNLGTKCNLIAVVAACIGFAGIKALRQGPRAPAVALVGLDSTVSPTDLLMGTKELYRRCMDDSPRLTEVVESASRETGTAAFQLEPLATLAYEALVETLVKMRRPSVRHERINEFRQRMALGTDLSPEEIEYRLASIPILPPWNEIQQTWDTMFMIDLEPRNAERFGIDWKTIVDKIGSHPFD